MISWALFYFAFAWNLTTASVLPPNLHEQVNSSNHFVLPPTDKALSTFESRELVPVCYPAGHDRRGNPRHPPISHLPDCGQAAHQLLSTHLQPPDEPRAWHPIRYDWRHGSCGISLMPNAMFSVDYFSTGLIAARALEIKSACVNEAHGWRGGEMVIGEMEVFEVGIYGIKRER